MVVLDPTRCLTTTAQSSSPSQLIHAKWHSRSPCPSAITPGTARRRKPEAATFGWFPGHTGACPLSQVQLWSPMQVRC